MFRTGGEQVNRSTCRKLSTFPAETTTASVSVSVLEAGALLYKQVRASSRQNMQSQGCTHMKANTPEITPPMAFSTASHCSWCLCRPLQELGPELEGSLWPALHSNSHAPDC